MVDRVWFGTKGNMRWIKAPAVNIAAGKQGWNSTTNYLNGGARVRRSKAAAKRYSFSWNLTSRDEIQPILDYADGVYGNGFIYYLDPFAADRNALPAYWASPYINCYDGPLILDSTRPELVDTGSSVNGYPVEAAIYTVTSTTTSPSIFVPIPPGYTAHIGAHGSIASGSAAVRVTPSVTAASVGASTDLALLSTSSSTLTNATFAGNSYIGINISLYSGSTGRIQLSGLVVRILPDGSDAPTGAFSSGQGSSGMSFETQPEVTQYNAALDLVGASVNMIETEAWTW